MAETHKEIVKVWIAPGCIVCDACETDCPEVFDVQEETCVIKPQAQSAEFTKPLTPSIITAAEGCPVEVIKFETIDVEGPEPWAGKEAAAAASGGAQAGAGAAAKKAGPAIPQGPPLPKWAKLLQTVHTTDHSPPGTPGSPPGSSIEGSEEGRGRREAGAAASTVLPAKAPVEAVVAALGHNAPPDAQDAVMVAAGFARPRRSVAERIREKSGLLSKSVEMTRREFNILLAVGWGSIVFTLATAGAALQSFLVPKVTKEPPTTFRAGKKSDYPTVGVYELFKGAQGVWIVRLADSRLVAISTTCTHLGCIPNWLPGDQKFKCPCHGSGFYVDGVNFEGPAPRPLERYKIYEDGEYLVVDKSKKFRQELGQWGYDGAYVNV